MTYRADLDPNLNIPLPTPHRQQADGEVMKATMWVPRIWSEKKKTENPTSLPTTVAASAWAHAHAEVTRSLMKHV